MNISKRSFRFHVFPSTSGTGPDTQVCVQRFDSLNFIANNGCIVVALSFFRWVLIFNYIVVCCSSHLHIPQY